MDQEALLPPLRAFDSAHADQVGGRRKGVSFSSADAAAYPRLLNKILARAFIHPNQSFRFQPFIHSGPRGRPAKSAAGAAKKKNGNAAARRAATSVATYVNVP